MIETRSGATRHGEDRGPGVLVRPPLLYIGTLMVSIVIDRLLPAGAFDRFNFFPALRVAIGAGLLALGVTLMTTAMKRFAAAGTPVRTSEAVQTLVTTGIYRLSRNPIYLGLTVNYLGIAVIVDMPVALVLLLPVLAVMHWGVIGREERYLEKKYGDDYRAFRRRVGRWLGPL